MSNNRKIITGMIAAAALAASGSLVYAQPQNPGGEGGYHRGGPDAGHGMMGHGAMGRGDMGHGEREGHNRHEGFSNPAARVEGHLAALKVELKITPAQEKAWQTFADKSRKQAEARIALHAQHTSDKPAAGVPQGLASMEARTAAVTELYAALTPEQKAIADKQFSRGHGGFRHGGHGHHRNA
jgi:protein CpxP